MKSQKYVITILLIVILLTGLFMWRNAPSTSRRLLPHALVSDTSPDPATLSLLAPRDNPQLPGMDNKTIAAQTVITHPGLDFAPSAEAATHMPTQSITEAREGDNEEQWLPPLEVITHSSLPNEFDNAIDLTVVTAYIDIGMVAADGWSKDAWRHPEKYYTWFKLFSAIQNPVVFYTDKESIASAFIQHRKHLPTEVYVINRNHSWAWSKKDQAAAIYADNWPPHYAHTTHPDYTCVTFLKFELIEHASRHNPYNRQLMAWVDIGLYRDLVSWSDVRNFTIEPLSDFDRTKIAFNEITEPGRDWTVRHVVRDSLVWFGAGLWFGTTQNMVKLSWDFRRTVEFLIAEKLCGGEQQVLAAMFVPLSPYNISVKPQVYKPVAEYNPWFSLAHLVRHVTS